MLMLDKLAKPSPTLIPAAFSSENMRRLKCRKSEAKDASVKTVSIPSIWRKVRPLPQLKRKQTKSSRKETSLTLAASWSVWISHAIKVFVQNGNFALSDCGSKTNSESCKRDSCPDKAKSFSNLSNAISSTEISSQNCCCSWTWISFCATARWKAESCRTLRFQSDL